MTPGEVWSHPKLLDACIYIHSIQIEHGSDWGEEQICVEWVLQRNHNHFLSPFVEYYYRHQLKEFTRVKSVE